MSVTSKATIAIDPAQRHRSLGMVLVACVNHCEKNHRFSPIRSPFRYKSLSIQTDSCYYLSLSFDKEDLRIVQIGVFDDNPCYVTLSMGSYGASERIIKELAAVGARAIGAQAFEFVLNDCSDCWKRVKIEEVSLS